jgi:hypothetical protein
MIRVQNERSPERAKIDSIFEAKFFPRVGSLRLGQTNVIFPSAVKAMKSWSFDAQTHEFTLRVIAPPDFPAFGKSRNF